MAFIIISGVIGVSLFLFSNDVIVNVHLDGENVTVSSIAVPFGKDIKGMEEEIRAYTVREMEMIESNATTLKSGIIGIASRYGFTNINVDLESQFGKDQIPMMMPVSGTSMLPTIQDGETVIIVKTQNITVGDIVVANDSEYGLLIKRVGKIEGDKVFLSADNSGTPAYIANGTFQQMVSVEKWVNTSDIVGIAKIFGIWK